MLVMEMSNKKQQIPAIRFNGFTDAWEQRKLGDTFEFSVSTNSLSRAQLNYEKGNIKSIHYGDILIKYNSILEITKDKIPFITDGSIEKYKPNLLENGDVVFADAAEDETVGKAVEINGISDEYVVAGLHTIVARPKEKMAKYFSGYYINADVYQRQLLRLMQGTKVSSISKGNLKKTIVAYPKNLAEQQKIGSFFKQLDNAIALHQRQLDNYKALKKVMLQKIFNQELRFKDQEGNNYPDWEKIALNELGETYTGLSGKTKEDFGKGKGRFVTYMNVYSNPIADLAMTENVEIKDGENQNEVCYGDIFFTTSSETPEEVGMSSVWLSHESKVYLNSFCFGYRLSSRSEGVISPDFLGFQLRAPHIRKKIIFLAQGSTRFNISKSKLMDIVVYMPTIEEQNKITAFLLNVDSRIKHTIQSIERLNMLKKALLQQMFI